MDRREFLTVVAGTLPAFPALAAAAQGPRESPEWRAGVATVDITPAPGLWMAGFAARTEPARGTAMPLHAKALALEDGRGRRAVLVTLDLLGVTGGMAARIAAEADRRYQLPRAALMLNASHTHCGPVVDEMLSIAYDLTKPQRDAIAAYTRDLEARIVSVIGDAFANLAPARLRYGQGGCSFAANRRVQFTPDGPVDHTVPVLHVERVTPDDPAEAAVGSRPSTASLVALLNAPSGVLSKATLAIVFGYACHNTTLQAGFTQFHGDYAGVAQAVLQARHPNATAMFVSGCGADANPKPRGTIELVEQHGAALADAVDRALPAVTAQRAIEATLDTAFDIVNLPFAPVPDREGWTTRLKDTDVYVRRHARLMLDTIERDGRLPAAQPDPIQVWAFGQEFGQGFTLIALGGEVVVDYAQRLKREVENGHRAWIAGYSNDVFGYVPSRRVLKEGGYEGGGAMIYYGRPGAFTPDVEPLIVDTVQRLVRTVTPSPPTRVPSPR
jgi:neutral ceramidase